MSSIETGRRTAVAPEDYEQAGQYGTLFLIGMRINAWYKPHRWWWMVMAMPRMIRELQADRSHGLLHTRHMIEGRGFTLVQYWESTEALLRYSRGALHSAAWRDYFRRAADGSAGFWHETYEIGSPQADGERGFEAVYGNMPRFGLGAAWNTQEVSRNNRARNRLSRSSRLGGDSL